MPQVSADSRRRIFTRRLGGVAVAGLLVLGAAVHPTVAVAAPVAPSAAASPISAVSAPALQVAAAKPKITSQPKHATALSGKQVKFTVKATGSKLTYRWYVKYPGTSSWVLKPAQKKASYTLTAKTRMNAYEFRVVVANADGGTTSSIARLKVLSNQKDPVAKGTSVWLPYWRVATVATSTHAWKRLREENRYNDPAPAGHEYVLTRFKAQHRATSTLDPAYTLEFSFVSPKGKSYAAAWVVTPDDLFDVGPIAAGKQVDFMVAVAVPSSIAKTGTWVVTDYTKYTNRGSAYFRY